MNEDYGNIYGTYNPLFEDEDYKNSIIYRIYDYVLLLSYYGSSIMTMKVRLGQHRSKFKKWLENGKIGNYCSSFEVLENDTYDYEVVHYVSCKNKQELRRIEGKWQMENECVNTVIAGLTPNESSRMHYYNNLEKEHARSRKYYNDNLEKERLRNRKYRNKNPEKIKQNQYDRYYNDYDFELARSNNYYKEVGSTEIECYCGDVVVQGTLIRHQNSARHWFGNMLFYNVKIKRSLEYVDHTLTDKDYKRIVTNDLYAKRKL